MNFFFFIFLLVTLIQILLVGIYYDHIIINLIISFISTNIIVGLIKNKKYSEKTEIYEKIIDNNEVEKRDKNQKNCVS